VNAQLTQLNTQALEAYQALDIDTARSKLEEALGVAQQAGYYGPEVAQTYMNLGVVFVAGMNDRDQGLTAFVSAVCIQADIQLDPLLSTPDVQAVYAQAQQDAQAGACGPGAAPGPGPGGGAALPPGGGQPMYQEQGYGGGQAMDQECPPGVVCEPAGVDSGPKDFARFFVNLQLAGGFAYVSSGMEADSRPPFTEIFLTQMVPGIDPNPNDMMDPPLVPRYYFDDRSAWVPDADSFDDYADAELGIPRGLTPVPGNCDGDGDKSGPTDLMNTDGSQMYTTLEPSRYCVRVETPGVVSNLALRLNPGYFLSDSFALSLPMRFQFNAGEGPFSHMLIGVRGELLFSAMKTATGFPVSWFFGATYGQIQAKPPPKDPSRAAPYVISGPFGIHTGINVRVRIHRNFGFIASPEIDVQLPHFLFNGDLAIGAEAAF
jgi:hypothetical protein